MSKRRTPSVAATITASVSRKIKLPPDPEEMNDRRAEAAENALFAFSQDMGELVDGEDLTVQNLTDLLADIGHFCDRQGIELSAILQAASFHYDEETDNEGNQVFSAS